LPPDGLKRQETMKSLRDLAENATPDEARRLLSSLRWREDMIVVTPFDQVMWLGPCYDRGGKRIGITECCFVTDPCDKHRSIWDGLPQNQRKAWLGLAKRYEELDIASQKGFSQDESKDTKPAPRDGRGPLKEAPA